MARTSLAKEFHRLMRRIGRLTDGQASIDDVNWEDGSVSSFRVIIRPNASYFKGGRFRFMVELPDGFINGDPPNVWCETDIYHPNIDRCESKSHDVRSNICLNIFSEGEWTRTHGLEGVVLGILFLMHNPNLNDALSEEFYCKTLKDCQFRKNVADYMSKWIVEEEFEYFLDFRVNIVQTGANCDTNDRGNGNDVVEPIEGLTDDAERDVENEKISAHEFHRFTRRIVRLTDGQASIDGGEWNNGELSSFNVTIRPNDSYYKGGRFKFRVRIPDGCKAGEPIDVWCITEIYHPNIDTRQTPGRVLTNVCFDSLDTTPESRCHRLESLVYRLVFLMHHPYLNDPLSPEFDSGSITDKEFRVNVLDYMAGKTVGEYSIDFRVIDGMFKDLTLNEESGNEDEIVASNCDVDVANFISINSGTNKNAFESKADIVRDENEECFDVHISLNDASKTTAGGMHTLENSTKLHPDHLKDHLDDYVEEDVAEKMPVKFVIEVDDNGSRYFVIDYTGHENKTDGAKHRFDDTSNKNDISENNATLNSDCGRTIETVEDAPNMRGCEHSIRFRRMFETYRDPLLARRVSVPNEGQAKAMNMHKQSKIRLVGTGLRNLLFCALDCLLTTSKNML